MKIDKISLINYRNIEKQEVEFSSGLNVIYGDNAQGKTNLIEAIYTFARGKSFRGAGERELVRFGSLSYMSEIHFTDRVRRQTMTLGYENKKKIKKINGVICEKLSDMIGRFRAVLFCPSHLDIVKGGPGERREFLNVALSQLYPEYIILYQRYKHILEQRNALLRKAQILEGEKKKKCYEEITVFSEILSEMAAEICIYREKYISDLSPFAEFFLSEMSAEKEKLTLSYECDIEKNLIYDKKLCQKEYYKLLTENIEREISKGATLYGIHRDDIKISFNGIDARSFASQGQQRSISLSLKMAEGEMSKKILGEYPVFLLDDVLSELDIKRRRYLMSKIKNCQIIISGCETDAQSYTGEARFIYTEGGKYTANDIKV